MSATPSPNEHVKTIAREWFIRMVAEQPSDQTRKAFEEWCAEDRLHVDMYSRYLQLWNEAANLKDLAYLAAEPPINGWWHRLRYDMLRVVRRPAIVMAGAMVGISLIAWQLYIGLPQRFSTGIGEMREFALVDGSRVTLGARSALEVAFNRGERHVTLSEGEAFFEVAHNHAKPFIVDIGKQRIRVVGTKFDVRRADQDLRVSVLEGVVQLTSPGAPELHIVRAGEEIDANVVSSTAGSVRPISSPDPVAWRRGRLVYIDAPLRDVIADANRYSFRAFVIRDEKLANERVSVTYSTKQVAQMLDGLARAIPFKILETSAQQADVVPDDSRPARP